LILGIGGGSLEVVWLVASFVAVDARNLPALLRAERKPVCWTKSPGGAQIAVPFRERSVQNLVLYRLLVGFILLMTQTTQLRAATDAHMAATMGSVPLLEASLEWLLMLFWSVYVVVTFRRAANKSRV
jgi:hypothetical protein